MLYLSVLLSLVVIFFFVHRNLASRVTTKDTIVSYYHNNNNNRFSLPSPLAAPPLSPSSSPSTEEQLKTEPELSPENSTVTVSRDLNNRNDTEEADMITSAVIVPDNKKIIQDIVSEVEDTSDSMYVNLLRQATFPITSLIELENSLKIHMAKESVLQQEWEVSYVTTMHASSNIPSPFRCSLPPTSPPFAHFHII